MPDRNGKHTFLYSICWRGMNILKYQFTEGLVVNVTDKSQMNKLNTCQVAFWTIYSYEPSKLGHRWIGYTPEKYGCNNLPMFIYQINYTSKKDPGYLDSLVALYQWDLQCAFLPFGYRRATEGMQFSRWLLCTQMSPCH